MIRKLILFCIVLIMLSASALSIPDIFCEKTIKNNAIQMSCLASKQINDIINSVLNDYNSVSDARMLSKELSLMDPDFVSEFNKRISEPGMKRQVYDYLKAVKASEIL